MKKLIKLFIFSLVLLPITLSAQFTGFQDETITNTTWQGDSSAQGTNDAFRGDGTGFQAGEAYRSNGNVDTNTGGPNDRCALPSKTLKGYVDYFGCAVRIAVLPFIFTLALVSFVWGVTVMMRSPGTEEAQKNGRTFILWGIIGFFVITSMYALIGVIRRTFGFSSTFNKDSTPYVQLKEKVQNLN